MVVLASSGLYNGPKDGSPKALRPAQRKPQCPRSTVYKLSGSHIFFVNLWVSREEPEALLGKKRVNPDSTDLSGVTQNSQKGVFLFFQL